jgi:hypothetical protein
METIAYIVGSAMGVEVPRAMPAVRVNDSGVREYGALLEWFYNKNSNILFMPLIFSFT